MQDFRNLNEQNSNNNGITRLPRDAAAAPSIDLGSNAKTPKLGFIEARMNKDNFWNLVFGLAFPLGLVVAALGAKLYPGIGLIVIGCLLIGIPALVRKNIKVIFTEDKRFLNSEGQDITERIPNNLLLPILIAVGVTTLLGNPLGIHGQDMKTLLVVILALFSTSFAFFFSFAAYFILINCPISVLFNLDVWKQKSDFSTPYQPHRKSSSFSNDLYYSPSYRHYSGNTYHRR